MGNVTVQMEGMQTIQDIKYQKHRLVKVFINQFLDFFECSTVYEIMLKSENELNVILL